MSGRIETAITSYTADTSIWTRTTWWCSVLAAALALSVTVASSAGPVDISYVSIAAIVADSVTAQLSRFGAPATSLFNGPSHYETIVVDVRLPRVAVAAVVGFALGASGAVMQGFFRNPMADPTIVGISSGAAVGAVAVIVYGLTISIQLAAFTGALAAAFTVYWLATENGRTGVATLLLAGIAVQMFLGAVVSYLIYTSDDESLRTAVYWTMGYLVHRDWSHVSSSLPVVVFGFGVLMVYARDLNVLVLGEEDAATLGVDPQHTKRVLLAVTSVVTAAAVAVAGVIGFVGLIVPHAMRLIVGPDHRILVPTSAFAGAVFLVTADASARLLLQGDALPVGIVTALVGVPFFLYLLRRREVVRL